MQSIPIRGNFKLNQQLKIWFANLISRQKSSCGGAGSSLDLDTRQVPDRNQLGDGFLGFREIDAYYKEGFHKSPSSDDSWSQYVDGLYSCGIMSWKSE